MAVLSGLERASGGSLQVAGADFATMDEDALAHARRGRIGIVLQAFHLLPTMTALENVAMMELAGADDAQVRARSERSASAPARPLSGNSGGEQQRVAIARAIAARPDLIFADEPTGNLDAATGHEIVELLFARRAEAGATLLVITHDPELAQHCNACSRADGRMTTPPLSWATAWRIARRDLNARFKGLRLLLLPVPRHGRACCHWFADRGDRRRDRGQRPRISRRRSADRTVAAGNVPMNGALEELGDVSAGTRLQAMARFDDKAAPIEPRPSTVPIRSTAN